MHLTAVMSKVITATTEHEISTHGTRHYCTIFIFLMDNKNY